MAPRRALAVGAAAAVAAAGAVTMWQVTWATSGSPTGQAGDASATLSLSMGRAARSAQAAESRAAERLIPAAFHHAPAHRREARAEAPVPAASGGRAGQAPVRAKASPAASPSPRPAPTASAVTSLSCSGTSLWLPANYVAIANFLVQHGYTPMGAAGIAGNIWQESRGNPESIGTGGGGLIGWTPLPPGFVTGNYDADLQTQLAQILVYNQQWSQYIPALNAATSPTQAADIYMNYFERPGLPAAINRETAAQAVAQACGIS